VAVDGGGSEEAGRFFDPCRRPAGAAGALQRRRERR
jgi:hypothetical protein